MSKPLGENAVKILSFLQENPDSHLTAADYAEKFGISKPSANGTITGLQRKGLTVRTEVEVEGEDKPVKIIEITEAGKAFDIQADQAGTDAE